MRILTPKNCPFCKTRIYRFKRLPYVHIRKGGISFNFRQVPVAANGDYAQFFILQSNGSRMRVACCKECVDKLTDESVRFVFADIVYTRLKQLKPGKYEYDMFDNTRVMEVHMWNKDEQVLINYLKALKNGQECKSK